MLQSRRLTGGSGRLRLEPPHASAPHFKPSTSSKHGLPKFCGCQWSSTAGGGARIGRRETPVVRRAMRAPLTASKLRKEEASIRSTALSAEPRPVTPTPNQGEAPPHNQRVSREGRRPKNSGRNRNDRRNPECGVFKQPPPCADDHGTSIHDPLSRAAPGPKSNARPRAARAIAFPLVVAWRFRLTSGPRAVFERAMGMTACCFRRRSWAATHNRNG